MRALIRRVMRVVVVLAAVFAALVTVLWVRTADPRPARAWERLADMPNPRGEVAAAVGARVIDDCPPFEQNCENPVRVVVAGGLAGVGRTVDTVSIYDPAADRWTTGPPLPEARHHVGAAGLGGTVYVTGGSKTATDWTPQTNAWALEPTSRRWRALPPMPEGRMGHQMAAAGQNLYVVGGRGPSAGVLIFDTITNTWSRGEPIPVQRDHLAIAVKDEQIWAIGGRDDVLLDRVDVYDIAKDGWFEGPRLPQPMSAMAAGALPDGIHVVGGEDPAVLTGTVLDRHFVLADDATGWRAAPLPIVPTHGSASVVVRDRLVVIGGARRQSAFSPIGWTGITEAFPRE